MVKRDEFLQLVENCTKEDLCNFIKDCRSQDSGNDCLQEIFGSCSRKQLEHAWQKVYSVVSATLLGVGTRENDVEDEQIDPSLQSVLEVVQCIVSMVNAMTNQKEVYIPDFLFQTALLLQEVLPGLPQKEDKIKNSIARLFEDWWKKNLQQREAMIITTMVYLVERSLDLQPKPLVADVKRVWSLHEVLPMIDLQNESSTDFKEMLRRCFISSQYMQQSEGIRFLGYVLSLDESFMEDLHRTIKNHLLSVPRAWHDAYGELYFRAWQQTSGAKQQKLEQNCIQDFMYHAVHAHRVLLPALKKLLGYIHKQKKQRGVDEMLYRLYDPIIWRSLRVANCDVRYNAAVLFLDVFPLQNLELNVQESDELLQKQFDLFRELLYDPFPNIRSLSVTGVLKMMTDYWEVIPAETLKNLIVTIVQDLLVDANSSDVRHSVIKGLTKLLDNPLSHLFLKPILPEIRNAFHDVSERVRLSMLDLLLKVKTLRTIKYWNIVPIEHLLARLVIDSDPVNKRIVKLVYPSFIPQDASNDVQLDRCIALIKSNPAAARQLFRYASQMMGIDDTVNYMSLLCRAVLIAIKNSNENGTESEEEGSSNEGNDESDEELKITDTPLMLGLCEIILILWTLNEDTLKKASNAQHKKNIDKKFRYALPEMLHAFSDPQIVSVLIQMAGHLPANCIPTVSRAWVPRLRNMTCDNIEDDYSVIITSVCEMGRAADILELVSDWITPSLETASASTPCSTKASRKTKKVGFVEQREPQPQLGLDFLSFMLRHHQTRDIVLRDHLLEFVNMRDLLRGCQGYIQQYVTGQTEDVDDKNEKFLQEAFMLYCKTSVLLHSVDNKKYSCLDELVSLLSWVDKHVLQVFSVKEEPDIVGTKRPAPTGGHSLAVHVIQSLLSTFNNMLLVGIGDLTVCSQLVDFCTSCLSADQKLCLLSDVMLCLYQVTEFLKFKTPTDADNSWTSSTIPNALSRILVNIASHVKQNPVTSPKLLGSVKGHMLELLKSVFTAQSPDDSVLPDVMATIFATVLAELSFFSSQFDLEEDCSPSLLPPVSSWLLDIVQTRPNILRFFVQEVSHFIDSEDIVGIHNVHGAVHLLGSLTKCKHKAEGLKDLWNVMEKKIEKQLKEHSEEDVENNKELTTAIETKLKEIQIS